MFSRRRFLETSLFAGASTLMAVAPGVRQRAHRLALRVRAVARRAGWIVRRARRSAIPTTRACADRSRWRNRRGRGAAARWHLRAASGTEFPARELRREGARGAARRGLAVPRALALRRAERARERRRRAARARRVAGSIARSARCPRQVARGGVALGANVPLAMRGPAEVASWSPTKHRGARR